MTVQPAPAGSAGAFSARTAAVLILTGVFAFCAFVALSAYAPELRGGGLGGGNALSSSAEGYAGAVRLLRLMGRPTLVNRAPGARNRAEGGMVLTPAGPMSAKDLGVAPDDRLIVLPKWQAAPDPDHPGWTTALGMIKTDRLGKFAPAQLGPMAVARRSGPDTPARLSGDLDFWPSEGMQTGPIHALQTVSGADLKPLITDERGQIVVGQFRNSHVFVLSDPDLIDTQGLKDPGTARAGMLLLSNLGDTNRPLLFDVTLDGIASAHSLVKLALEPPFLGATLCLALAAALIGLQGWSRFGPTAGPEEALARGKTALVENGAGMVRLAKREPRMAARYVRLCRERAVRALGAGELAADAQDAFLDRWAERLGARERVTALLAEAGGVRTTAELVSLAQRARDWRAEMTREAG